MFAISAKEHTPVERLGSSKPKPNKLHPPHTKILNGTPNAKQHLGVSPSCCYRILIIRTNSVTLLLRLLLLLLVLLSFLLFLLFLLNTTYIRGNPKFMIQASIMTRAIDLFGQASRAIAHPYPVVSATPACG